MHTQFLQERKYLRNVSAATLTFYQSCFKALPVNPENWKADLLAGIQALKARGVQPTSINDYIRGVKAFLLWCHQEGHLKEKPKIQFLKCEQKILATLSADNISSLIRYKATGTNMVRAHMVALVILDTGLRASEVLGLTKENCDLDNLTLKVLGKGGRHRLVPFSAELRKLLFRFITNHLNLPFNRVNVYMFGTKHNTTVSVRNLERDFKVLGQKVGITGVRFSPHVFRHTMAVNWIRNGGDIYMLQRILGHSNINTTTIYLKSLGVADIQAVHSRISILSKS